MSQAITSIRSIVDHRPELPQFVLRPHTLMHVARYFCQAFPGTPLYAVKTNPSNDVLQLVYQQGVRHFDVASLEEVKQIHALFPDCTLYFMHPIKSRTAIREAYHSYGVRHFSLDSSEELQKILAETDHAKDLHLHVRLSIPNNFAELALAEKFGINLQDAPALLTEVAQHAYKVGTCFHVGSQCMHPDAYRIAMRMASEVIQRAGIAPHYFNVGGGFPSIYPGMTPPPMQSYFDAIHEEFTKIPGHASMQLIAEPGRAIVAESMSLIVRVDMRKHDYLYINDGTYGSLFDAGTPRFIFPMKRMSDQDVTTSDLQPFSFYGPTCDSLDYMEGPFYLPNDITEGDYIEIGQMGAYGRCMATGFNGFKPAEEIIYVNDEPLMSMYNVGEAHSTHEKLEIIAA
jgi:ornithine decarboxylase